MDDEQRYNRWVDWLENIEKEVTALALYRYVFRETVKLIDSNQAIQLPSVYFSWMRDAYVTYVAVGIRKQLDLNRDAVSMRKLLLEISKHPQIMSRERYKTLYRGAVVKQFADRDFDRFSGSGGWHIEASQVQNDLDKLVALWDGIKQYINRKITHIDQQGINRIPTFADLDNCQDALEELLKKYVLLFRASNLMSVVPVIQDDWQAIFRRPWISNAG